MRIEEYVKVIWNSGLVEYILESHLDKTEDGWYNNAENIREVPMAYSHVHILLDERTGKMFKLEEVYQYG